VILTFCTVVGDGGAAGGSGEGGGSGGGGGGGGPSPGEPPLHHPPKDDTLSDEEDAPPRPPMSRTGRETIHDWRTHPSKLHYASSMGREKIGEPRDKSKTQDEWNSYLGRAKIVGSESNSQAGEKLLLTLKQAIQEASNVINDSWWSGRSFLSKVVSALYVACRRSRAEHWDF